MSPWLLSGTTFGGVALIGAVAISVMGDAGASRPVYRHALFTNTAGAELALRANSDDAPIVGEPYVLNAEDVTALAANISLIGEGGIDEAGPAEVAKTLRAALPIAPLAGLTEKGVHGLMPIVAKDGRRPLDAYSRPFSGANGKPMVSLVVGGLGLNARATDDAISELPPEITLSFVPYAKDLQTWVNKARAHGHEVMLELPMEGYDYPDNDTGPYTLMSTSDSAINRERLGWLLSRATGYFGVMNYQGSKFGSSEPATRPVLAELRARGLGFAHDGVSAKLGFTTSANAAHIPYVSAERVIDNRAAADDIDEQLLQLEALALQNGQALGVGFGYPVTIEQVKTWTASLADKGYALAPASALLKGQPGKK